MTDSVESRIIRRLDELLDLERQALLAGDLSLISRILNEKAELIETLNVATNLVPSDLTSIQAKLERNRALLDGALRGIRAVAARMAIFRSMRQSMETYDHTGRRHTITGAVTRKVEKRA